MSTEPTFEELQLAEPLLRAIHEMGFTRPTPVQSTAFAPIRAGRDLVVQSQTGTGKTAAFGIGIAGHIDPALKEVQVLVLAPTRELAAQVAEELARLTKYLGFTIAAIYGGARMGPQVQALNNGASIVVGTPGRILDHLRRRTLRLGKARCLVLDEADEMLSMGFKDELEAILDHFPEKRQTLLFSATVPPEIRRMIDKHLENPEELLLSGDNISPDAVTHYYYISSHMRKADTLIKILQVEEPDSALIFCNTREDAAFVGNFLKNRGYDAETISGALNQTQRERVMKRIKSGGLHLLAATDIAARGIDINRLSHVINWALPESPEVYVHRTGRTGRAGLTGTAISIVSGLDIGTLYQLTKWMKITLKEKPVPTEADIRDKLREKTLAHVRRWCAEAPPPNDASREIATALLESPDNAVMVGQMIEALTATFRALAPVLEVAPGVEGTPVAIANAPAAAVAPDESPSNTGGESALCSIALRIGDRERVDEVALRQFLCERASLTDSDITSLRSSTGLYFVDIPAAHKDRALTQWDGSVWNERPVAAEMARRQPGDANSPRGGNPSSGRRGRGRRGTPKSS